MHQVLFYIPFTNIPINSYGMMLFLAFFSCLFVASWRAWKEGIPPDKLQDVAMWVLGFGLLGARTTYMIQYGVPITEFFAVWNGGLVFYGCLIGGAVGYLVAYFRVVRKHHISTLRMADVIASCVPLGLAFGRIGCFLNGCCYGNVACTECPAVHFPMCSPARYALVERGVQTAAGFIMSDDEKVARVARVEPGSPAAAAGLKDGDIIVKANDQPIDGYFDDDKPLRQNTLAGYLAVSAWPRGKTELALTVRRSSATDKNKSEEIELPAFAPRTVGLHPTQLYESISMVFLFLFLSAFYPFRPRIGSVMVLFMLCYAVHRFLNEMLRKDTDPVAFGLTLSQNGSILLFVGGVVIGLILWRTPTVRPTSAAPAAA